MLRYGRKLQDEVDMINYSDFLTFDFFAIQILDLELFKG